MRGKRLAPIAAMAVLGLGATLAPAAIAGPAGAPGRAGNPGAACAGISEATGTARDDTPVSVNLLRRCLRLNQIQVLGTHNSYRRPTTPEILTLLKGFDPTLASGLEYEHLPLAEQFDTQEIRQIELDVFADPVGGLYSARAGLGLAGLPNDAPAALSEPGFKTLHIQDLDFNTWCLTFVDCLRQVKAWSDANERHLPIAILVELKDGDLPEGFGFVKPVKIGTAELDALDAEIRSVFGEDEMITPDDVRGDFPSLEAAVRSGAGWPTLAEAQGKVLFTMDNGGPYRDAYRAGRPSLEGRVLFTNATPGSPDAAFVKVNGPVGNVEYIQGLVADGYVVRTMADPPRAGRIAGDRSRLDAALASGAQWVSTDYPVAGFDPFSEYFAEIPGGDPARCNPVNTGPRCAGVLLERRGGAK